MFFHEIPRNCGYFGRENLKISDTLHELEGPFKCERRARHLLVLRSSLEIISAFPMNFNLKKSKIVDENKLRNGRGSGRRMKETSGIGEEGTERLTTGRSIGCR